MQASVMRACCRAQHTIQTQTAHMHESLGCWRKRRKDEYPLSAH